LNQTETNSFWTESEFFFRKTEPKLNRNKKIYSTHPYIAQLEFYIHKSQSLTVIWY